MQVTYNNNSWGNKMSPTEIAQDISNNASHVDHTQAVVDLAKVGSVWAAVGITSWADAASAIAFLYTAMLAGDWIWKKIGRPFFEARGWVGKRHRRKSD